MKIFFLLLIYANSIFAQTLGFGMPSGSGSGSGDDPGMQVSLGGNLGRNNSLNLSFLPSNGQCSFEPQISADDKTMLTNAERAVKSLREFDKCKALINQFEAFRGAVESYNLQTGADRLPGYDGATAINCSNYEQIFDLEYDYFLNYHDASVDLMSMTSDPFANCRSLASSEAISCGAIVTGRNKALKKKQCDISQSAINAQKQSQLLLQSYKSGLEAIQAIINHDQCLDASGDQKLTLIQSAVGLAGRAASIGVSGGPQGLLIGMATDVIGSVVNKIFNSTQKGKDNLSILENRNNFTKLACLYEKLEDKANRCDRISASQEVEKTAKISNEAQTCLAGTHQDVIKVNSFVKELDQIVKTMATPPAPVVVEAPKDQKDKDTSQPTAPKITPPKVLKQDEFDSIVQKLNEAFPGTQGSVLEAASKSTTETIAKLKDLMSSDDKLKAHLEKEKKGTPATGVQLSQFKTKLQNDLKQAEAMDSVLSIIKASDDKGTQMGSEDLDAVSKNLRAFADEKLSFAGAFNKVLSTKVYLSPEDDLSGKIKAYNLKIDEASVYEMTLKRHMDQTNLSQSQFHDNGNFAEAKLAMRPHLKKILDQELSTLFSRGKNLKDITPGSPSTVMKEQMQTQEEEIVYPILRACNQLRSVMNADGAGLDTDEEHEACKAVNCPNGTKTFANYLNEKTAKINDAESCQSTQCQGLYARFVCQERTKLPTLRHQLKNEFLTKGTLCGRPLAQAFGR
jgi:hypothetical protein